MADFDPIEKAKTLEQLCNGALHAKPGDYSHELVLSDELMRLKERPDLLDAVNKQLRKDSCSMLWANGPSYHIEKDQSGAPTAIIFGSGCLDFSDTYSSVRVSFNRVIKQPGWVRFSPVRLDGAVWVANGESVVDLATLRHKQGR